MAREVARGDIWMYRFAEPDKRRPVVVLSRDAALRHLRTCVVAAITSTAHGAPSEVEVGVEDGLKHGSVIKLDHLFTVPQSELRLWLGQLREQKLTQVCRALAIALGCSATPEH